MPLMRHTTNLHTTTIPMSLLGSVHSVESCGTVDGPGIRMVVFFSGCPMRCKYCHNPDTRNIRSGKDITAEELLEAKEHPETHGNLRVRVSGFSDYFVNLTSPVQQNIIERTVSK